MGIKHILPLLLVFGIVFCACIPLDYYDKAEASSISIAPLATNEDESVNYSVSLFAVIGGHNVPVKDATVFIQPFNNTGFRPEHLCRAITDENGFANFTASKDMLNKTALVAVFCYSDPTLTCAIDNCLVVFDSNGNIGYQPSLADPKGISMASYATIPACKDADGNGVTGNWGEWAKAYNLLGEETWDPVNLFVSSSMVLTRASGTRVLSNDQVSICMPISILMGLLIASMFYMGINPFFWFSMDRAQRGYIRPDTRAIQSSVGGAMGQAQSKLSTAITRTTQAVSAAKAVDTATGGKVQAAINKGLDKAEGALKGVLGGKKAEKPGQITAKSVAKDIKSLQPRSAVGRATGAVLGTIGKVAAATALVAVKALRPGQLAAKTAGKGEAQISAPLQQATETRKAAAGTAKTFEKAGGLKAVSEAIKEKGRVAAGQYLKAGVTGSMAGIAGAISKIILGSALFAVLKTYGLTTVPISAYTSSYITDETRKLVKALDDKKLDPYHVALVSLFRADAIRKGASADAAEATAQKKADDVLSKYDNINKDVVSLTAKIDKITEAMTKLIAKGEKAGKELVELKKERDSLRAERSTLITSLDALCKGAVGINATQLDARADAKSAEFSEKVAPLIYTMANYGKPGSLAAMAAKTMYENGRYEKEIRALFDAFGTAVRNGEPDAETIKSLKTFLEPRNGSWRDACIGYVLNSVNKSPPTNDQIREFNHLLDLTNMQALADADRIVVARGRLEVKEGYSVSFNAENGSISLSKNGKALSQEAAEKILSDYGLSTTGNQASLGALVGDGWKGWDGASSDVHQRIQNVSSSIIGYMADKEKDSTICSNVLVNLNALDTLLHKKGLAIGGLNTDGTPNIIYIDSGTSVKLANIKNILQDAPMQAKFEDLLENLQKDSGRVIQILGQGRGPGGIFAINDIKDELSVQVKSVSEIRETGLHMMRTLGYLPESEYKAYKEIVKTISKAEDREYDVQLEKDANNNIRVRVLENGTEHVTGLEKDLNRLSKEYGPVFSRIAERILANPEPLDAEVSGVVRSAGEQGHMFRLSSSKPGGKLDTVIIVDKNGNEVPDQQKILSSLNNAQYAMLFGIVAENSRKLTQPTAYDIQNSEAGASAKAKIGNEDFSALSNTILSIEKNKCALSLSEGKKFVVVDMKPEEALEYGEQEKRQKLVASFNEALSRLNPEQQKLLVDVSEEKARNAAIRLAPEDAAKPLRLTAGAFLQDALMTSQVYSRPMTTEGQKAADTYPAVYNVVRNAEEHGYQIASSAGKLVVVDKNGNEAPDQQRMVSELEQAQQDLLLGIAKEKSAGARQVQLTSEDVIKSKAFGSDEARNAIELDRYAGIHRTLASIIDQGYAVEVSKTGRPIVVDDKGREAPEQQKLVSGLDKAQQDILYKIAKDKEAGEALTDEDILKSARKMQEVAYPIAQETRLTVSKNLNNIAEYARTAKEYTLSMRDRTLGDIEIRDSKGSEVTDPSQKSQILSILSFGEFSGVKPALKEEQEKMRRAAIDLVEDTVPLIADRIKDNSILVSSKGQVNILGKGERPIKDETEILERFSLSPKQMDKSSVSVLKEAAATAANPRDAAIEIEKKTLLPEIAAIKEVPVSPYAITEAGKPPYKPGSKEVTVSDYTAAVAENLASASPLMYSMTRSVEKSIFSTISGVSPAAGGAPIDALHRDYAASAQALAPKSLLGIGAPKVTKEAYSARASYMDIMTSESIKDPSFSGVSSATGIIPSLLSNMPIETRMLPKTPVVSPQELEKAILGKDYIAKLAEQDLEKAKLGEDYMAKLAKESAKQRYAEGKPPEEPEEPPKKPPERPKKGGKA